jgi:hypothetical protein
MHIPILIILDNGTQIPNSSLIWPEETKELPVPVVEFVTQVALMLEVTHNRRPAFLPYSCYTCILSRNHFTPPLRVLKVLFGPTYKER